MMCELKEFATMAGEKDCVDRRVLESATMQVAKLPNAFASVTMMALRASVATLEAKKPGTRSTQNMNMCMVCMVLAM